MKQPQKTFGNLGKISRILPLLIVGLIMFLLIVSAPANAFVMNLSLDKNDIIVGDKVIFNASVDIESNENLPVSKLVLKLTGSETVSCEFNADGSIITGCKGITIKRTSNSSYEYGYGNGNYNGYGYNFGNGYGFKAGKLGYEITLDSNFYKIGTYKTELQSFIGSNVFSKTGPDLKISSQSSGSGGSGGYYSYTVRLCTTGWKCTEWSECENGYQTRSCAIIPNCYLETRPIEKAECTASNGIQDLSLTDPYSTIQLQDRNLLNNDNNGDNSDNSDESNDSGIRVYGENIGRNFMSGITGSVIGPVLQSPIAIILAVLIILLLGLILGIVIFIAARKRRIYNANKRLDEIMWIPPKE